MEALKERKAREAERKRKTLALETKFVKKEKSNLKDMTHSTETADSIEKGEIHLDEHTPQIEKKKG